jgi:hypothetical protein
MAVRHVGQSPAAYTAPYFHAPLPVKGGEDSGDHATRCCAKVDVFSIRDQRNVSLDAGRDDLHKMRQGSP